MSNPVVSYDNEDRLESETWFENDKCHRIDGPAVIWYYNNGKVKYEAWWENDYPHRINAPALIWYYEDGDLLDEAWFENGIELTDQQVTVIKRKLKLCQIQ